MFILSFLVVALFTLDASFVSARPRYRRSPTPVAALEGFNTNSKRLIAGLPPLPPVRRWTGSPVDAARRHIPSLTPSILQSGEIEVINAKGKRIGWLSDQFKNGHYRLAHAHEHAKTFTATLGLSGTTYPANFKDSDDYLTGLVNSGSSVILTRSSNPSDTAIWSYDATSGSVTGLWIQSSGGPVPLHIWYDNPAHTFYLTESADPPTQKSKPVTFHYVIV